MALAKKILKAATKENHEGLSSLLVPRKFKVPVAIGVAAAAGPGLTLQNEAWKGKNLKRIGTVSYSNGMQRMTDSFTTGAVEAMNNAAQGNYAAFTDMAEEVVTSNSLNPMKAIDNYGVTPALISSLYGMGGR